MGSKAGDKEMEGVGISFILCTFCIRSVTYLDFFSKLPI